MNTKDNVPEHCQSEINKPALMIFCYFSAFYPTALIAHIPIYFRLISISIYKNCPTAIFNCWAIFIY